MIPGLGQNACGLKLFRVTKLTSFQRSVSFRQLVSRGSSNVQVPAMEPSKIETVPVSEENVNEVQHPDTEATLVSTTQTAQHSDTNSVPILLAH